MKRKVIAIKFEKRVDLQKGQSKLMFEAYEKLSGICANQLELQCAGISFSFRQASNLAARALDGVSFSCSERENANAVFIKYENTFRLFKDFMQGIKQDLKTKNIGSSVVDKLFDRIWTKFFEMDTIMMACLIHPNLDCKKLLTIALFYNFLFTHDDKFVDIDNLESLDGQGKKVALNLLIRLHTGYLNIFKQDVGFFICDSHDILTRILINIQQKFLFKIKEGIGEKNSEPFINLVESYFVSIQKEFECRIKSGSDSRECIESKGSDFESFFEKYPIFRGFIEQKNNLNIMEDCIPDLFKYINERLDTGAVKPCIELGCLLSGGRILDSLDSLTASVLFVCFFNDITSCYKEIMNDEEDNIPMVFYNHNNSFYTSFKEVGLITNFVAESFEKSILTEPDSKELNISRQVLHNWMSAYPSYEVLSQFLVTCRHRIGTQPVIEKLLQQDDDFFCNWVKLQQKKKAYIFEEDPNVKILNKLQYKDLLNCIEGFSKGRVLSRDVLLHLKQRKDDLLGENFLSSKHLNQFYLNRLGNIKNYIKNKQMELALMELKQLNKLVTNNLLLSDLSSIFIKSIKNNIKKLEQLLAITRLISEFEKYVISDIEFAKQKVLTFYDDVLERFQISSFNDLELLASKNNECGQEIYDFLEDLNKFYERASDGDLTVVLSIENYRFILDDFVEDISGSIQETYS
ncbi:hypothetical protein DID75_03780 [Candidatus Marinamargulisbacteria bacterium SCGC AG-410-N11]|nr:hypothetical protein DID75_03780 [Candidatus Marinamargulisbacteria bacterium SCGC AG-410-N11]